MGVVRRPNAPIRVTRPHDDARPAFSQVTALEGPADGSPELDGAINLSGSPGVSVGRNDQLLFDELKPQARTKAAGRPAAGGWLIPL
jgi:hypothetical protein